MAAWENNLPLELVPPPKEFEHASTSVKGVWRRGTYWYLDTRREELSEMNEEEYSWLMPWIAKVNNAIDKEILTYGTLLHGDVKGANILLNRNPYDSSRHSPARSRSHIAPVSEDLPLRAALYDFQYVGIGLSTLDLVYFIGTSIQSSLLSSSSEMNLLRHYHSALLTVIRDQTKAETNTSPYPFDVFLKHWELAIVDWYRFMAGWGFWGNDRWAEQRAKEIVKEWGADPTTAPA
ncbi:unnamed protein product [Somion occarium]|uniref:Protein kinase domain-containing protein n=1 Tax=Somion occarium TaxID=3059160 RepID=A0ABP1DD04_9APHY